MFNKDEYEDEYEDIRYLFNENEDIDEDKESPFKSIIADIRHEYIRYFSNEDEHENKESPFKSLIQDIRNILSKNGDKLIKKGLYYVEEMKKLTESQVKNIKEKLIIFKNEIIIRNKLNNRIKNDLDDHNGNTKYKGIKDIRYLFNKDEYEDEYEDIRYLFNENEDIDEDKESPFKSIIADIRHEYIRYFSNEDEHENKESPFKSLIQDIRNILSKNGDKLIKKGLYYVEEMKKLTESQVKNIKEKLVIFKNEIIIRNKLNNRIKNDLHDHSGNTKNKGIKDIRYLFNKDEDEEEYEDIRYLFSDNICKGIKDIRYLFKFNEDYYIENIKSEFEKISNSLVEVHNKDVRYMVDYINNSENLKEIPIDLEDIKDKFIAYNGTSPFGMLSISSYIDLKNEDCLLYCGC